MTHSVFSNVRALPLGLMIGLGLAAAAPEQARSDAMSAQERGGQIVSSDEMVQIRVLPGWIINDGSHIAALHLTLAPGWKTYWRAPGDAGIPPALDLSGSRNLSHVTPVWPTPAVFSQNGMKTVGYDDELILPLHVVPQVAGQPAQVSARMQIGVCSSICVPLEFDFMLDLPAAGSDPQQAMIRTALADQPVTAREAKVSKVACTLTPIRDGLGLSVEIDMPSAGKTETVLIETSDPQVWVAETDSSRSGGRLNARTELVHVSGQAFALDRSGLRFTVLGSDHAVDIHGCTGP
ncbi:MAG: protein-disulfide reductase DsbD domain-containing protein [Rhodobacterales bacterium]